MSFKSILTFVEEEGQAPGCVQLAIDLAKMFEAHLTGIYIQQSLVFPTSTDVVSGSGLLEAQMENIKTCEASAQSHFEKVTQLAGVNAEWRAEDWSQHDALGVHAHYSDLLIAAYSYERSVHRRFVYDALIGSGRPVLVVPDVYSGQLKTNSAVVAWNGSAQAARAVHDAMPLLARMDHVFVTSVEESNKRPHQTAATLCEHLSRHDIQASWQYLPSGSLNSAKALLQTMVEKDSGLLVMGAYGHHHFRELILGGFTQYVLKHMQSPIFMSH